MINYDISDCMQKLSAHLLGEITKFLESPAAELMVNAVYPDDDYITWDQEADFQEIDPSVYDPCNYCDVLFDEYAGNCWTRCLRFKAWIE